MTGRPLLGLSLHPDRAFLSHHRVLIEDHAEVFEIMPEALWREGAVPGVAYDLFREIQQRSGRPFVAHGTLFSLGAVDVPERRQLWLDALRRDQEVFEFLWFSDHFGFADAHGLHTALPLPLPPTPAAVQVCAAALDQLGAVFPIVAFENNVAYFGIGDPYDELSLFSDVCARTGAGIVLDLHNAFTTCCNFGLDLDAWLARVELDRVLEIHLSGGSDSDPEWLPSRRQFRLDSHDGRVPEPVWTALENVLPRCPSLRAVIVEQVADGIDTDTARVFAADFERALSVIQSCPATERQALPGPVVGDVAPVDGVELESLARLQRELVAACLGDSDGGVSAGSDFAVDGDGLRLSALLIKKLRFERLIGGDDSVSAWFERDPEGLIARWGEFAHSCSPTVFPEQEARAFSKFCAGSHTNDRQG